jgi:hypothetical protein
MPFTDIMLIAICVALGAGVVWNFASSRKKGDDS